jgi:hypothetical protein
MSGDSWSLVGERCPSPAKAFIAAGSVTGVTAALVATRRTGGTTTTFTLTGPVSATHGHRSDVLAQPVPRAPHPALGRADRRVSVEPAITSVACAGGQVDSGADLGRLMASHPAETTYCSRARYLILTSTISTGLACSDSA